MSGLSKTLSATSKWPAFVFMGLGIVLVVAVIAYPFLSRPGSKSISAPLPTQRAGFSLASEEAGGAAFEEFSQLHGKSFPVVSGAKGVYGAGGQAIIWAAGTASTSDTRKLLEEMGQKHFYFQSGKTLVWLAANAEIADQALEQALDFYP